MVWGRAFLLVIAPYSCQVLNGSVSLALSAPPPGGIFPRDKPGCPGRVFSEDLPTEGAQPAAIRP